MGPTAGHGTREPSNKTTDVGAHAVRPYIVKQLVVSALVRSQSDQVGPGKPAQLDKEAVTLRKLFMLIGLVWLINKIRGTQDDASE
jgi:hypothetical protein